MSEKAFCAQISREHHESCIGTAARVDTWLMIEYTGAWGMRAVEQSTLSPQVKDWIQAHRTSKSNFLPVFIRQHHRPLQSITCFVCIARENQQAIYCFILQSYEEIISLDIDALAAEDSCYDQNRYNEPLYLVCTHGKHDMCCAKYGLPIYQEFARLIGHQVWQSSHLGGDKFAANILYLPQSIYYGRVAVPDVEILLDLHSQQQIYLQKCRGQTCYTPVEQAANLLLRQETGIAEMNAFSLIASHYRAESDDHVITFQEKKMRDFHQLTISHVRQEMEWFTSCKGCWRSPINTFSLRGYRCIRSRSLDPAAI